MNKFLPSLPSLVRTGIWTLILFTIHCTQLCSQCLTGQEVYDKITELKKILVPQQQLIQILAVKDQSDKCRLLHDSVYALMLHRIGVLKNSTGKIVDAISYTRQSIQINMNGKPGSNRGQAIVSYNNLGNFYMDQKFYTAALSAFDSCITLCKEMNDNENMKRSSWARHRKGYIYHQIGDDLKDIYETTLGLKSALLTSDTILRVTLLTERAQAYISQQQPVRATADLDMALLLMRKDDYKVLANNYKLRAGTYEAEKDTIQAKTYYKKAISARFKAKDKVGLAKDYLDAGNFLRNNPANYAEVRENYQQALRFALDTNDNETAGKALNNLGITSYRTKDYKNALQYYQRSMVETMPSFVSDNILQNPSYTQVSSANKVFLYQLLSNKAESLLFLYKQTNNTQFLSASLATSLLTDSIITGMRHEQTEELSKLHWLKDARDVFANALEACYLSGNITMAFYFMEKSRSVLLNDRLNELGANAILSAADAEKERNLLINISSEQQQLLKRTSADPLYSEQETRLLETKEKFESFVNTLQRKYPLYYQYKYADDVPSLPELRKKLTLANQCFIHYFISDTCIYILVTTPQSGKMFRQSIKSTSPLSDFVNICSDRQRLNKHYEKFAALSSYLYSLLLKPLQLSSNRVIICNDNFLLPFEALTTDSMGQDFLLNHYAFSYAYSARSLMKKFDNPPGDGICLLVAPASYDTILGVSDLNRSQKFLEKSGSYYSNSTLLKYDKATKNNFLRQLPHYTIVSIYSHASADSSDAEPLLYLQDSVIRLSELEMLYKPSTKLVILSACQTSVGKNATGEGIYSLARGFAAAGIPSIATTLWKADEEAMYFITDMFHLNISRGMRKDEALQQAKLALMKQGSDEHVLPYYWATMILAGDTEPVELIRKTEHHWWIYILVAIVAGIGVIWWVRRKNGKAFSF